MDQINTAFNFINNAKTAFISGSIQTKKDILASFGKSLVLKDGIIKTETNDWLVPIGKLKSSFSEKSSNLAENTAFENNSARTKNKIDNNRHNTTLYPSLSVGQGRQESNPQPSVLKTAALPVELRP